MRWTMEEKKDIKKRIGKIASKAKRKAKILRYKAKVSAVGLLATAFSFMSSDDSKPLMSKDQDKNIFPTEGVAKLESLSSRIMMDQPVLKKINLLKDFEEQHIPPNVAKQFEEMFPGLQKIREDRKKAVSVEIIYNKRDTGRKSISFVSIDANGQKTDFYKFTKEDGQIDYATEDGHLLSNMVNPVPIKGAGVRSHFSSSRLNPVLKVRRAHEGLDITSNAGTEIPVAAPGTVIKKATEEDGYGNYIDVDHGNGVVTRYAHLKSYAKGIKVGTVLEKGEFVGRVGNTGIGTGPHLHFEIRVNNQAEDPLLTFAFTDEKLDDQSMNMLLAQVNEVKGSQVFVAGQRQKFLMASRQAQMHNKPRS